jgi:DNA (cytosine-5)-methyltransferase 1
MTLYNEVDSFAASWLEQLITHGHIAPGTVNRRSIADLTPADVAGDGQRHFFAGIGGWSYALRRAGVADDTSVWTGSCPCQPFSDAGKGLGASDPRHLWPAWFSLIRECRPPVIFGEQVASRDGLKWLDLVYADLERCDYAVGSADLCAAGVGAPHQRQRLYFVAYASGEQRRLLETQRQPGRADADGRRAVALADGHGSGLEVEREQQARRQLEAAERGGEVGVVEHPNSAGGGGLPGGLPGAEGQGQGQGREAWRIPDVAVAAGATRGPWDPADWILCRDPSGGPPVARPVEPGTFPLATGVPRRVGLLRGYGNALTTEVAVTFIRAALDVIDTP